MNNNNYINYSKQKKNKKVRKRRKLNFYLILQTKKDIILIMIE
jgi:hypothetical protein